MDAYLKGFIDGYVKANRSNLKTDSKTTAKQIYKDVTDLQERYSKLNERF